ncbi:YqcI/YcgG family protein [Streptomyces sp. NPDC020597]|uniref:YqcI/YcgG family protein n=1 Tax=unclassified Streptomyces TaxID=2593676 RepID=UPI00379F2270
MVQKYGGYWQPTSAAFHLYEELIAVDESLEAADADRAEIGAHLMEILVSSVCIATQYSVDLKRAYREAGYNPDILKICEDRLASNVTQKKFEGVVKDVKRQTASIARVITFYQLDRLPVDALAFPTLHEAIPRLHSSIIEALLSAGMSFRDLLQENLRKAADSNRFERPFDPGTAPCLADFAPIKQYTACPFAGGARLWGAPAYQPSLSIRENLRSSLPLLASFTRVAQKEILDGFLYAFPVSVFGSTLDDLCRLVKTFVSFLVANDPLDPRVFAREEATRAEWRFSFGGEEYFVNVFSPLYRHDHSRYTHGVSDTIFIMLQPEKSFHLQIPKDRYHATRDMIRGKFDDTLQGYELDDLEAHRFVLPRTHGDPPVRWYDLQEFEESIGGYVIPPPEHHP